MHSQKKFCLWKLHNQRFYFFFRDSIFFPMGSQIYCLLIMIDKCSIIFIIETNVCISVYNADYDPIINGVYASRICIVIT